jgi:hypothetical protein
MKTYKDRLKRILPFLILGGFIFLLLLGGRYKKNMLRSKSFPASPKECLKQNVEQYSESDSGKNRSTIGVSAFMIGLPF